MKNGLARLAVLSCALVTAPTAMAFEDFVGVNYTQLDYSGSTGFGNPDMSFDTLMLRLMTTVDHVYAGEMRIGMGISDDSVTVASDAGDVTVDADMGFLLGFYGRLGYPVGQSLYPYAIAGLTYSDVYFKSRGAGINDADEDYGFELSAGVGVDFSLNDKHRLTAEYMVYDAANDAEVVGMTLGWMMRY